MAVARTWSDSKLIPIGHYVKQSAGLGFFAICFTENDRSIWLINLSSYGFSIICTTSKHLNLVMSIKSAFLICFSY